MIHFNQIKIFELLLENGADPAQKASQNGNTSLHCASESKEDAAKINLETLRMLIRKKPTLLNTENYSALTPLHFAVNTRNPEIVTMLLQNGANSNAKKMGVSAVPLIFAINIMDREIVRILLKYGADYTITSSTGKAPLDQVNKLLIDLIPDLGPRTKLSDEEVIKIKSLKAIERLLLNQYEKDKKQPAYLIKDSYFNNFLSEMVKEEEKKNSPSDNLISKETKAHKELEKYKLQKETSLPTYEVALHRAAAAEADNAEDIKFLIELRAKFNEQDDNPEKKRTALYWAVINANKIKAETLIAAGADSNIRDAKEKTAQDYAREHTNRKRKVLSFSKSEGFFNYSSIFK